jgi:hypothetical protein
MVSPAEVGSYLTGVGMLAKNDSRGFDRLDLTADGFWRSFGAILYTLPAFVVSWASYRQAYLEATDGAEAGLGFFAALAAIDLANWIVPVVLVGVMAGALGIAADYGRWVIATNWLSVPVAYALALPVGLGLLLPGFEPVGVLVSLVFFGFAIALLYRVSRLSLSGNGTVAFAIVLGVVVLSFMLTGALQNALGVAVPAAS